MKRRLLLAALAVVACEERDTLLLESTTTKIPCQGGVATSADGRFAVRFDADTINCDTEVTVETVRDFEMDGLVSFVYRVGPKGLVFARQAEVSYALDGEGSAASLRFVVVDEDRPDVLEGSAVDAGGQRIRGRIRRLDKHLFAIHRYEPPGCETLVCNQACELCEAGTARCVQPSGYCDSAGACRPEIDVVCLDGGMPDGWTTPPGRGRFFVINGIGIGSQEQGFDIDGRCDGNSCIDNVLWPLGELTNDQFRQALLGGDLIVLLELAGLDEPYIGEDPSLTFKVYGGIDADDPVDPANNFKVPPGEITCCEFRLTPQSLSGIPPQARTRSPSRIERGRLRTLSPVPLSITLGFGVPPYPELRLERALVSSRVPSNLREMTQGVIGAAVAMGTLAQTENPFCRTVGPRCPMLGGSSMLDFVSTLVGPPDVDLDGDGLECVRDLDGDGEIDLCCDGAGVQDACVVDACTASAVPPVDPARPWTCALRPEMADGFSIGLTFSAVAATIR